MVNFMCHLGWVNEHLETWELLLCVSMKNVSTGDWHASQLIEWRRSAIIVDGHHSPGWVLK